MCFRWASHGSECTAASTWLWLWAERVGSDSQPRAQSYLSHLVAPADESGDEESVSQTDKTELQNTLRTLSSKVEDLSTCNDLIAKHGTALQRSLSELESLRLPAESNEKIKQVNERATLFRITSNAMINVSVQASALPLLPSLFQV